MTSATIETSFAALSGRSSMTATAAPETPVRVLQLLDTAQFAGTERLVLSLTASLARAGVIVTLGCRRESPLHRIARDNGLDVLPLFTDGLLPGSSTLEPRVPQVRAVLKAVRRQSIDVVHAHNGRTTLAAAMAARFAGATAVASQHFVRPASADYRGAKRVLVNAAHGWVNRQLAAVVAVSSAARSEMIRRVGFPEDRIIHVPNGLETPAVPSAAKIAAIREELGVPSGAPLVVTVARLAEEKGLEYWVDAVAELHQAHPHARFVIVGEGPRREAIVAKIAACGLGSVLSLAGFRSDATDWIAAGDVFVLPSPAEPFGLVLLEAMSLGKPVIACAAAGPLDIITSGVDGMLVSPHSASALAGAVSSLLTNADRAARIATAGRATFHERFTADRMASQVVAVYRQAIAWRGSARRTT